MTTRATMMLNAIACMSTLYMPRLWQRADKVNQAVFPAFADARRAGRSWCSQAQRIEGYASPASIIRTMGAPSWEQAERARPWPHAQVSAPVRSISPTRLESSSIVSGARPL